MKSSSTVHAEVSSRLLKTSEHLLPDLVCRSHSLFSPLAAFAVSTSIMASQDFISTVTLTDAQKSSLVELEPAFEHLLRDVGLEEGTIHALRHCRISDRETFTGLAGHARRTPQCCLRRRH